MADGGSGLQDDELYLPRTVVNKLIKEIVPNIRVSTDARDLLLNCCTEFIHLLASEASDISERQQKKVISPEHVVEALNTLGFQEYVVDVKAVHKEYKEQASKHRKRGKSKLDKLGIPEEELHRQQQQLFEEARQQQMESELLEQQRLQQHPAALQYTSVGEVNSLPSDIGTSPVPSIPLATTPAIHPQLPLSTQAQVSHLQTLSAQAASDESPPVTIASGAIPLPHVQSSQPLPQSAAFTVASLQATSNLIQQALAMASAQMAANSAGQLIHQGLTIPSPLGTASGATLPILLPKPPPLSTEQSSSASNVAPAISRQLQQATPQTNEPFSNQSKT